MDPVPTDGRRQHQQRQPRAQQQRGDTPQRQPRRARQIAQRRAVGKYQRRLAAARVAEPNDGRHEQQEQQQERMAEDYHDVPSVVASAGGVWAALMAGAMPARAPVMVPMAGAARRTAGSMVGVQVRVMATATTAMSPMMVE